MSKNKRIFSDVGAIAGDIQTFKKLRPCSSPAMFFSDAGAIPGDIRTIKKRWRSPSPAPFTYLRTSDVGAIPRDFPTIKKLRPRPSLARYTCLPTSLPTSESVCLSQPPSPSSPLSTLSTSESVCLSPPLSPSSSLPPAPESESRIGSIDSLPYDLLLTILSKVGSSANCSADFISVLMTSKRLNELATHSLVLSKLSLKVIAVKAQNWSDSAHQFLKRCVEAGNVEACYTLGMILFYCLQNKQSGASLMAKAAIKSHAPALYALAVIHFNGSGRSKNGKDLKSGVALCARAAFLGHVDALREVGHCLQDGYGVAQNIPQGRRYLVKANTLELAAVLSPGDISQSYLTSYYPCPLLSDFGCNVPPPEIHPANQFLYDWFSVVSLGEGLRLCSYGRCGRPETRKHEFRRCSVCGVVNYCSRACQALDWKLRHKMDCMPLEYGPEENDSDEEGDADIDRHVNGNDDLLII